MASTSSNSKKMDKKEELPTSNSQRLIAQLLSAQNKTGGASSSEPSTSTPKQQQQQQKKNENKKKNQKNAAAQDDKKKPKGQSVGARMQQQAEMAKQQQTSKKQRSRTTSEQVHFTNWQNPGPPVSADVLDELEFRFISNMDPEERKDNIRVCYNLELAHWYYIDHMVESNVPNCPNLKMPEFTCQMYAHCKALSKYANKALDCYDKFKKYKATIATYGAILMDPTMEYVVLVQSFFAKCNSWGFPKGKINQSEPPREAAIRETFEETGYDFGAHSEPKKEKQLTRFIFEGLVQLYVVRDVPMDFQFAPQTRKEIRHIRWFKLDDLPTDKKSEVPSYLKGFKFYMASPFVKDIQNFVAKEKERQARKLAESAAAQSPAPQAIFAKLFPDVMSGAGPGPSSSSQAPPPVYKRMTSEELFSMCRKPVETAEIARPTLPEMSATVDGLDSLSILGLCTPLKPGASLNQFAPSAQNCPIISEETAHHPDVFPQNPPSEVGFAMPTDLQQPVVTTEHPFPGQQHKTSETGPPPSFESHQGWLGTQMVNTVMHSPNPPIPSADSPATPTAVLGHLIGKPIQPQAIVPQAATPTALGSAEKPKSSRISLSDNSAFKAINPPKQSVPKATAAPPSTEKMRSASLSGTTRPESQKTYRNQINSLVSPASSGLNSVQGEDVSGWEESIWLREQLAATAETSISSLAASNQELAMYNRETPVEERNVYVNQMLSQMQNQQPKYTLIPLCEQWKKPLKFDAEYIAGPIEFWNQQFSIKEHPVSSNQ